jgi:hypothetical protein
MGQFLIRIADGERECFMEWSTVSDAPSTSPGSETELREFMLAEYGRQGCRDLDERIARCRERGHSVRVAAGNLADRIGYNRAGEDGTCLTMTQMVDYYLHCGGEGPPPRGERIPGDD